MIHIEIDKLIKADPDLVFKFISNFENNPRWQKGMKEATFTSDPPLRIGSTYDQKAKFLGKDIVSSFEVIDYIPGKMIKATSTAGSFPITFTRMVEKDGEYTRVKAVIDGDSSGFFKLAEPLMKIMVGFSIKADYKRLKKILEL